MDGTLSWNKSVYQQIIDRFYPHGLKVRDILLRHSHAVAEEALAIAHRHTLSLGDDEIVNAAMLHDIGIIRTNASGIGCYGLAPYLCHGVIGADMLRACGADEKYALVCERHTGAGLTSREIVDRNLSLPPDRSYMPESLLEKLICYADCFYSKSGDMQRKDIERVRRSMEKFGPEVLVRFEGLHRQFG